MGKVQVEADIPQIVNYVATTVNVGSTTTLPSGADATITNSGTDKNAIFNFGIPKGIDGIDGKSAYEQAVEGGYQGTEEEFEQALASDISTVASNISSVNTAATNMADIIAAPTAATNAANSATNAQIWAEGTDSKVTPLGGEHSSKGWANIAKQYAESIGAALKYKGSVPTYYDLPSTGQQNGDVWNVLDTGANYAWTGTEWDKLSETVDLSGYYTKTEVDTFISEQETNLTTVQNDLAGLGDQVSVIESKIPAEASETNQLADKKFVQDLTSALNFVTWVDTLPETGESKYIYAVPREEIDTDGKQIAALYLWDGTRWNGAGAFSLNIDPDTLATKTDLADYLPLTGGTLSGRIEINTNKDGKISLFNKNNFIGTIIANGTSTSPNLVFANNTGCSIGISHGSGIFLKRENMQSGSFILCNADKSVANGVASLDANAKVPSAQIPVATASTLGGVKPDGTTITVTEDGTISASVSGEGVATKAELQALDSSKADTSLANVDSNIDYVVESYHDADGNWYRKYKSGWLEQGGIVTAAGAVTLLKPFANTAYSVQATSLYTNYTNWGVGVNKTSVSSFNLNMNIDTQGTMWEAKGQGAE